MARKYGSQRSLEQRQADNKGVKDGTIRKGAGGKTMRRYNSKTGRWTVIKVIDKEGRTRKAKKVTPTSTTTPVTQTGSYQTGQSQATRPTTTSRYKVATKTKRYGPQFGSGSRNRPDLGSSGSSYNSRTSKGSAASTAALKAQQAKKVQVAKGKKLDPHGASKGDKRTNGPSKQVYDGTKWVTFATKTGKSTTWKPTPYGKSNPHLLSG